MVVFSLLFSFLVGFLGNFRILHGGCILDVLYMYCETECIGSIFLYLSVDSFFSVRSSSINFLVKKTGARAN